MKFINEIKETFKFIKKDLGKTVIIVTVVFFIAAIASGIVLYNDTDNAKLILEDYLNAMNGLTDSSGNISFIELLKNNIFACVTSIAIGIIPFVFLPAISLLGNSIMIGTLLGYGEGTGTINAFKAVIFGMLPHGIFEFPGILLSMALGIYLCKSLSVKIITRNKEPKLLDTLNQVTRVFVLVIVPLIIMGALVECFITPSILELSGIN